MMYLLVLTVWLNDGQVTNAYWGYTRGECFTEGRKWLKERPKDGNKAKFACLEDRE
jgi:hypothetical protein